MKHNELKYGLVFQMSPGRKCVEHYRSLNRYCVFSHDEMTCNIATKADSLELELASAVQKGHVYHDSGREDAREKVYKMVGGQFKLL